MLRVYCASPFSASTAQLVEANIDHAVTTGIKVRALGAVPVVPHITVPPFLDMDVVACWEPAMRECLSHLKTCQALLLTGDWRASRGCQLERLVAYEEKIPAFESVEDLAAWLAEGAA